MRRGSGRPLPWRAALCVRACGLPKALWNGELTENGFELGVIGGGRPEGICGPGSSTFWRSFFLAGWIDLGENLSRRKAKKYEKKTGCMRWSMPWAVFYQSDVDEFLRTKAAASTMVEYMLRRSRDRNERHWNFMWLALWKTCFKANPPSRLACIGYGPGEAHQCGKFFSGGRRKTSSDKKSWMNWMTSWTKWYIFSLGLSMIFWNSW